MYTYVCNGSAEGSKLSTFIEVSVKFVVMVAMSMSNCNVDLTVQLALTCRRDDRLRTFIFVGKAPRALHKV